MNYDKRTLGEKAKELGFVRDTLEKVLRLIEILDFMNNQPVLKSNLVLKGGTAINLTIFNLPRLSVDIDMDLAVNYSLEEMQIIRKNVTDIIQNYMNVNGYSLSPNSKTHHSLDSMVYTYVNAGGNKDNIKIEINYSLRAHIFEPVDREPVNSVIGEKMNIKSLNSIELFAAKLNALMSRAAVRDLYDVNNMIHYGLFDESQYEMLRKCVVFYAAISAETINKNFSTDAIDVITINKVKRELFPVIAHKEHFDLKQKKTDVKSFIGDLMKLTKSEIEFLENFEQNKYMPELLFEDKDILKRISNHPMALWKMQH